MNTISIIGRLGRTPSLKTTPTGVSVVSFSLAVKRPHKSDVTDWLNFVAWRNNAEYLCKYAKKGNLVGVVGYLTARGYDDKNGNKQTAIEIVVDALELLESREKISVEYDKTKQAQNNEGFYSDMSDAYGGDDEDELPF